MAALTASRRYNWRSVVVALAAVAGLLLPTGVMQPSTIASVVPGDAVFGYDAASHRYDVVANQVARADFTGSRATTSTRLVSDQAGAFVASSGWLVAPEATRLATRADELHGVLDPIAQTRRTTAVLGTSRGTDVLAGGVRDLSPAQRALAGSRDLLARFPGEHAEITALKAAQEAGLSPRGIATTTNICPACRAALEEAGATITGPRSAWWWP